MRFARPCRILLAATFTWLPLLVCASAAPVPKDWTFQPLARSAPPADARFASPIDRFISARLAEQQLTLAPPADKATLLRRVTLDLHGLPPAPAELAAFLADDSAGAFAKVVDRLLASPRYGERWARHWLDLARFSESDGFEYDKMRAQAWPYRDYLVRSFNDDQPYAQFIREQLAGDALEPATRAGLAATGFLVAGPYDEAGNISASALLKARIREEEMEDIIAAVSQTFLGLSVNCARCHDHKFDPIPQRDYYRLKAALDGVRHGQRPFETPAEARERTTRLATLNVRVGELEKQIAALENIARARLAPTNSPAAAPAGPAPIFRWTFDTDARDSTGALPGELLGGAAVANGRLQLNGQGAFVRTAPLPRVLREKTLEAWVALRGLTQRGGGVISVESETGAVFDAIVFGERVPGKWSAGSEFFRRTRDLNAPEETAQPGEWTHVAVVYRGDGGISVYHNGEPYGETYTPGALPTFAAGHARVLLGLRHTGAGQGFLAAEIEEARLYDRALSAGEIAASARSLGASWITAAEVTTALTKEERREREQRLEEIRRLRDELQSVSNAPPVYAAVSREPEPTFVLARGDVERKQDIVTAGGLSALAGVPSDFGLATNAPEARRRRQLADWIASPDNPLTWRVLANRVWHHHFGRGLVGTPNDFGANGERPSHPELLDWLAGECLAHGGRLKHLHRLILLSAVYQQASDDPAPGVTERARAVDGDNRLLWRFPLRRLEGEAVRDAMLAVSGQLNPEMGGPGFRPFNVTVSGSHFYELTDPSGPEFNRRTLYRMNIQSGKDPLLDALDCPDPSTKTPARTVTTTPIQSLGLMNNAFVQRQSRHFAARLEREAGGDQTARLRLAYRLAYGRNPRSAETARSLELARAHGWESVCWALLNSSEFLYVR